MTLKKLFILTIVVSLMSGMAYATDVTFQVMMSFQIDEGNFNPEGDRVVVRGSMNEWGGDANELEAVEDGENGLYAATFDLATGDTGSVNYEYKFVIIPAEGDDRWESFDENRVVEVGDEAVVIDPVWFDNREPVESSDVTFQVMMAFQVTLGAFDPDAGDIVVVRGTVNGWGGNDYALEAVEGDTTLLMTGTFSINRGAHEYKYVIVHQEADDQWEGVDNRPLEVGDEAMELDPVWFNNLEPVAITDVEALLQVDMSVAIDGGLFNPESDAVVIRGGHDNFGNWGGFNALQRVGASDVYANWFQFDNAAVGANIEFKFVIDTDNDGEDPVVWEELPQGGNRMITPSGDENDQDNNGYGEIMPEVVFWADNPGNIAQEVTVTFQLDTHPAFAKFEADSIPGVDSIGGFWIAGLGDIIGWNWGGLPDEARFRDDGEAPDENADDMIYYGSIVFPQGTPKNQIYKYGINMLDNEAGFGENHFVLLEDEEATMMVADIFGSNGDMYDDYMSVDPIDRAEIPTQFEVSQNFPNPFNSSTSISFNLDVQAQVTVKVFDLTGAEVMAHQAGTLSAGSYQVTLDVATLSSGTYIYRVEAGKFSASKKMMLLK